MEEYHVDVKATIMDIEANHIPSIIPLKQTATTTSEIQSQLKRASPMPPPQCSPSDERKTRPPPAKRLRIEMNSKPSASNGATALGQVSVFKYRNTKKYIYGNYNRYYGYRNQSNAEDSRLTVFKQHPKLFGGKDVCDIGCNDGAITSAVAQQLGVRFITGLDIDKDLIGVARKRIFETKKKLNTELKCTEKTNDANSERFQLFPYNISYHQCNYVLDHENLLDLVDEDFDTLLCLSVTKWIQLNYGDAGLKLAFKRMFKQLRTGGHLILEAQDFTNYKRRKNLTPEIKKNYREIKLFPNQFEKYLLSSEIGFTHSFELELPPHAVKGFQRPIKVFVKGSNVSGKVRSDENVQ